MQRFDFFFGVELGRKLLNMVDNLSRSLPAKTLSACEGQRLVNVTLVALQSINLSRNLICFGSTLRVDDLRLKFPLLSFQDVERSHVNLKPHQSIQLQLRIILKGYISKELTL